MSTGEDTSKVTIPYKKAHGKDVLLDIYPPTSDAILNAERVPALIFFHGGGLTVGDRSSWFPTWLKGKFMIQCFSYCSDLCLFRVERVTNAGFALISPDYSLIPPSSGHAIVEDIKELFEFISKTLNDTLQARIAESRDKGTSTPDFKVDPEALAVAGASAGGLCAYLASIHAHPKPKAVVALYAMGGDFLVRLVVFFSFDKFLTGPP